MTASDALDDVWAQVTARLDQLGVPVYPTIPELDCLSVADWPDPNWAAFLDVAARAGVALLYARPQRITAFQVEELREAADQLAAAAAAAPRDGAGPAAHRGDGLEGELDGDLDECPDVLLDADGKVRRWRELVAAVGVGAVAGIEIGFVVGGVLHLWAEETDEWNELTTAVEEAAAVVEQLGELADRRAAASRWAPGALRSEHLVAREGEKLLRGLHPRIEEWAGQLAASAAFIGGSSQQVRWRLAAEVIPELAVWRELPDRRDNPKSWARHWAAGSVCARAEELLPAVKDRRRQALADRVHEVAAKLAADPEFTGRRTKPVRRQFVRDVVTAELGFGSAELTDRVLELADELRGR